jgi:hypothetical protein
MDKAKSEAACRILLIDRGTTVCLGRGYRGTRQGLGPAGQPVRRSNAFDAIAQSPNWALAERNAFQ